MKQKNRTTDGWKVYSMELPDGTGLTNTQVRYLFMHLTKSFSLLGEEFNNYIDKLPKCQGLTIDQIFDRAMEMLPKLLEREKNANTTKRNTTT